MVKIEEKVAGLLSEFTQVNQGFLKTSDFNNKIAGQYFEEFAFLMSQFLALTPFVTKGGGLDNGFTLAKNNCSRSIRHLLNKTGSSSIGNYENHPEIILNLHRGGLCNRLRALCSLASLQLPRKKYFYWQADESCDVEFNDLFDIDLTSKVLMARSISALEYGAGLKENKKLFLSNDLSTAWSQWNYANKNVISWDLFRRSYESYVLNLFGCVRPGLLATVNDIDCKFNLNQRVGIHVRRGDFGPYYHNKYGKYLASASEIVDFMMYKTDVSSIYLSCDDFAFSNDFIDDINRRAPGVDIATSNSEYMSGRLRETSVESAVVDILCLSKCKNIIGTAGSSFSEMAHSIWSCAHPLSVKPLLQVANLEGVTSTFLFKMD